MKNSKNSKYCQTTACCWAFRHELLGIILLVIAAFLTIVTCNGLGIFAMFLVGGLLCCYRHLCCHIAHGNVHCQTIEDELEVLALDKADKPVVRKSTAKVKK